MGGNPVSFIDPSGLGPEAAAGFFRPPGHKYIVGRDGHPLVWSGEQGPGIGTFIDDYIPAGHTLGTNHDALVDYLTNDLDVPDVIANIPTMVPTYGVSLLQEIINVPFRIFDWIFDTNTTPFMHTHPSK